jgi:hypothetical protein
LHANGKSFLWIFCFNYGWIQLCGGGKFGMKVGGVEWREKSGNVGELHSRDLVNSQCFGKVLGEFGR